MSDELPFFDLEAEQVTLGAAMLSPSAAATVVERLRSHHFVRGAHQHIFEAIMSLYGKGAPTDPVAVKGALEDAEKLTLAGGAVYLHTLLERVPSTSNVGYYADRLLTKAEQAAISAAGVSLQGLAAEQGLAREDLVESAWRVLERAVETTSAPKPLETAADMVFPVLEMLEKGPDERGVASGWPDLNALIPRFKPGRLITVGARPGIGKALALDTPIPTPAGWTTMKDLTVGDYVIGADGKPTRVIAATDVMYGRDCYDVEFSDGTVITADAQHQWLTETRAARRALTPPAGYVYNRQSPFSNDQRWKNEKPSVKTTEQIAATLRCKVSDRRPNHSVRICAPLQLPPVDLPIDPYILGYWLGDGRSDGASIAVGVDDLEPLLEQVRQADYHYSEPRRDRTAWSVTVSTQPVRRGKKTDSLSTRLRRLDLLQNKHIPEMYLRASEQQRRALLAGLLDSDGTINPRGRVSFEVTNRRLAEQFYELAVSLGYQARMNTKRVKGRSEASSTCYRVGFVPTESVFRLPRKAERVVAACRPTNRHRYIVDVRKVPSVPVRCIQVDNADHMYLASKSFIPTHNSVIMANTAYHVAVELKTPVFFATLEMTKQELMVRMFARAGKVDLGRLEDPDKLTDDDWNRLNHAKEILLNAEQFVIDDEPHMSIPYIQSRLRAMRRAGMPAGLVVIDYLQLMEGGGKAESRQVEVSKFSRALKLLAKQHEVPVMVGSQLNRLVEQRATKRPMLSDLRESGAVEQDSDIVILLHREDAYDPESPRAGEIDLIVEKNRSGPRGTVSLAWQGHYARASNLFRDTSGGPR